MPDLSPEQAALKASIQKSALIWALILGALVGGFIYMLNDEFAQPMRALIGGDTFIAIASLIFFWRSRANSAAATCPNCNAGFSISRTGRVEKTLSSAQKETRDAQPDYSTKVVTWVEETIEITDTYTCAKCGDTTTKINQRTNAKDRKEKIEPAAAKDGGMKGASTNKTKAAPAEGGLKKAGQTHAPAKGKKTGAEKKG